MFRSRRGALPSWLILLPLCGGCGFDLGYALSAMLGQAGLLAGTIPVEEALASGNLTPEQQDKLEFVLDARAYARDVLGLNAEGSFELFFDSGDGPAALNVSASRRDSLEPKLWTFPFFGTVPNLSYFDQAAAADQVLALQREGLDAYAFEIDAYSLAILPNPVLSRMLRRSEAGLTDTVVHELVHRTIGRLDSGTEENITFNETLATFIGRRGALDYFRDRFPDEPERAEAARGEFEDADRYAQFVLDLLAELDGFYKSSLTSEEKIAGREAIFQAARDRFGDEILPLMHSPERFDFVRAMPTNNACLLLFQRYNLDLDVFADVFDAAGQRWPLALSIFGQAAAFEGDPYTFMRNWVAGRRARVARSTSFQPSPFCCVRP